MDSQYIVDRTRTWLEKAVIGLNLCPFAKPVHQHQRIRFCVTEADTHEALIDCLRQELQLLSATDPQVCETTLLIHPSVLTDFFDYNIFLSTADDVLADLNLEGVIQIASFHPEYQFAENRPDDIENYTNRSPYPMLHLLREASIEKLGLDEDDADKIVARNVRTLRALGLEGWQKLWELSKQ